MKATNYVTIPRDKIPNMYPGDEVYLKDADNNLYKLEIKYDECPESPREWDNVCTILSGKGHWNIADEGFAMTREEADEILNKPDTYYKPIYMYEHSGQTISLSPFGDPWDSGLCGFIFVTKDRMKAEGFDVSTDEIWHKKADEIMDAEVEVYDSYIQGETYGYVLSKAIRVDHSAETGKDWSTMEFEEEDSCYGFYGGNIATNGILDSIPRDFEFIDLKEE